MEWNNDQLKELQKIELEMLKEFLAVCEKLELRYYLWGGTLLGAVRHQGFIPWDDDIDVAMPREDYDKFLREGQALLPEHLFIQTYLTDPEYPQIFAKIRNSNTTFVEEPVSKLKMNHGVFIDIFPLDADSAKKTERLWMRLKVLVIGCRISYRMPKERYNWKVRLARPLTKLVYPTVEKAQKAWDAMIRRVKVSDWTASYLSAGGVKDIMPTAWYEEGVPLTFEGLTVTAPKEYDKWLTQAYGDYMQLPPVEKRKMIHEVLIMDAEKSYVEYV